jgi:hypothetical protein
MGVLLRRKEPALPRHLRFRGGCFRRSRRLFRRRFRDRLQPNQEFGVLRQINLWVFVPAVSVFHSPESSNTATL